MEKKIADTTLCQIITDRMATALKDAKQSLEQAANAALEAEDRATALRGIEQANPQDGAARAAYGLAKAEYHALVEIVGASQRLVDSLTYALGDIEGRLTDCRSHARRLAAATAAAEAA